MSLFRLAPRVVVGEPRFLPPLDVGGRSVPVEVKRSGRAGRLTLRADPVRGALRLTLAPRTRLSEGAALITSNLGWIREQVSRWPVPLPFADGAAFPFDGGTLTIVGGGPRGVRRDGDRLLVGGDPATLPGRVTRWLKAEALAQLTAATEVLAADLRVSVAVRVGDPAARWGSCSSAGRIAYSWRLILAPPDVRHSVVAHEVAHLVHANHGRDFWALAAKLNGGDPAPQRRWLKANGPALHWVGRPLAATAAPG